MAVLNGVATYEKVLLRAAAGAGKSYALVHDGRRGAGQPQLPPRRRHRLRQQAGHPAGASASARSTDASKVCLFVSEKWRAELPDGIDDDCTVVTKSTRDPGGRARRARGLPQVQGLRRARADAATRLGAGANGERIFDVLFVDEAWQLPLHLFTGVEGYAPVAVGVGDVGQLPPIDPSENPWRGDPGYNPYRAWPTAYETAATTFARDLPAVWRPDRRAAPAVARLLRRLGPARLRRRARRPLASSCRRCPRPAARRLGSGRHRPAHAARGRRPRRTPRRRTSTSRCSTCSRSCCVPLLEGGFATVERDLRRRRRARTASVASLRRPHRRPARRRPRHPQPGRRRRHGRWSSGSPRSSTCPRACSRPRPSTPGRARPTGSPSRIHPLSGADQLDDFNSAFGRLAVTCTRATHGLLCWLAPGSTTCSTTPPRGPVRRSASPAPGRCLGRPTSASWRRSSEGCAATCDGRGPAVAPRPAFTCRTGTPACTTALTSPSPRRGTNRRRWSHNGRGRPADWSRARCERSTGSLPTGGRCTYRGQ